MAASEENLETLEENALQLYIETIEKIIVKFILNIIILANFNISLNYQLTSLLLIPTLLTKHSNHARQSFHL